ncbi:hypothetical protein KBTX_01942 [wastewater metagenome]|uniref:Endolytic murein transglycosylase n=2 Tax=unclassified sequences TaxID=12908 RepID=A0A5B8R903_9ZZZZ|nr:MULTISPECIES: endolytic transglycosylase MltG [Arhodomonas]MCS4503330.1 endolytic transglycosylase MltG [Arhodomonas aquaeolei]QEA05619.1 hypothetical protein KBTEX_01942 [uncultured organism]
MKRWLTALCMAAVFAAAATAAWAWQTYETTMSRPLVAAGSEPAQITVARGDTLAGIARRLVREERLKAAWPLRLYGRYTGDAARIKAGEYRIAPGTSATGLLRAMVTGDVIQHELTIVEGWTARQLFDAVANHDALEHTLALDDSQAVMAALGHPDQKAEGRFLPETYHFPRGTSDRDFLQRAYRAMNSALADAWEGRADDLPLENPDDALILASIIEKETGVAGERARIAGVFARRLRRGMRLQTDPTVIYGLGEGFDGNLTRADLRRDNPYNTYTRAGLPPTPIALPGRDSLHAAVHPADGDALYFVADGKGGHVFSSTLEAHNRAVRRYQLNGGQ